MIVLYNISILFYKLLIHVFSLFNTKAKLWITGRKNLFEKLKSAIKPDDRIIWFHSASLGEFEQGRPVIEALRAANPEYKILITFFSPSGYEIRKNYKGADFIFYLPIDTKRNARRFIEIVKPEMVFFIKYEFWYHYIKTINRNKIPLFLISAIFRKNQIFFKWYGSWYQKILKYFDYLFVQNLNSIQLLDKINIKNKLIAGDTRFDRVFDIAKQTKVLPLIEKFKSEQLIFIAGSSWQPDEEIIIQYINSSGNKCKFIIAPHEIHESHIQQITSKITKKWIPYSQTQGKNIQDFDVLIIDNIGLLSSIYKYAEIAYIGGGFGVGIHNTLEAATYGLPIIFGPNYQKFNEAVELIEKTAATSISNYQQFKEITDKLILNSEYRNAKGLISKKYIENNIGATDIIIKKITEYFI